MELSDNRAAWAWSLLSRIGQAVFLYWVYIIVTWVFKNMDGDPCIECSQAPQGMGNLVGYNRMVSCSPLHWALESLPRGGGHENPVLMEENNLTWETYQATLQGLNHSQRAWENGHNTDEAQSLVLHRSFPVGKRPTVQGTVCSHSPVNSQQAGQATEWASLLPLPLHWDKKRGILKVVYLRHLLHAPGIILLFLY